jgi:putative ABC transport system permease protein
MFLNTILLALRSIRRNLLRSFLTILGIVIGVSAVITMVTLGNGATAAVQAQISSLGTNLLQIRPGQRMSFGGGGGAGTASFKEADAEAIASQIGGVQAVAPEGRASAVVVANGRNWSSSVTGAPMRGCVRITGRWRQDVSLKKANCRLVQPSALSVKQ